MINFSFGFCEPRVPLYIFVTMSNHVYCYEVHGLPPNSFDGYGHGYPENPQGNSLVTGTHCEHIVE